MADAKSDTGIKYRLLEVDAWAYDDGWTWNNAFEVCHVTVPQEVFDCADDGMRKFLREFLCERGYSANIMDIEKYGEFSFEFQSPYTKEPLLAFEPAWE